MASNAHTCTIKLNCRGSEGGGDAYQKHAEGERKSKFLLKPCPSVFNLRIGVCSCMNLSLLLGKFVFKIIRSTSEIEETCLLMFADV